MVNSKARHPINPNTPDGLHPNEGGWKPSAMDALGRAPAMEMSHTEGFKDAGLDCLSCSLSYLATTWSFYRLSAVGEVDFKMLRKGMWGNL